MPRVEGFKSAVAPRGQQAFVQQSTNADMFGAGQGRAMGQLAGSIQQFGQQTSAAITQANTAMQRREELQQQENNKVAAIEADRQMTQWGIDNLDDPENGYYATSGKAAIGGSKKLLAERQEFVNKLREGLHPSAHADFDNRENARRATFSRQTSTHEAQQRRGYFQQLEEDTISSAITSASSNANDFDAMQTELKIAVDKLQNNPVFSNLSPEQQVERVSLMQSQAYLASVKRLAQDSVDSGVEQLAKLQNKLTPEDAEEAQEAISDAGKDAVYGIIDSDNPLDAIPFIDDSPYLDNKEKLGLKKEAENMADRLERRAKMSQLQTAMEVFPNLASRSRAGTLTRREIGQAERQGLPTYAAEAFRKVRKKQAPVTANQRAEATNDFVTRFIGIGSKKKDGRWKAPDATMEDLFKMSVDLEVAHDRGLITRSQYNGWTQKITRPYFKQLAEERGEDDIGWFWGDSAEEFDAMTQAIQDHVDKQGFEKESVEESSEKARILNFALEGYFSLNREDFAKADWDKEINGIATKAIKDASFEFSPVNRTLEDVPNVNIKPDGTVVENGGFESKQPADKVVKLEPQQQVRWIKQEIVDKKTGVKQEFWFMGVNGKTVKVVDMDGNIMRGQDVEGNPPSR